YNEYITDVIISVIVYLSAFSLVIKMWLGRKKDKVGAVNANAEPPAPKTEPEAVSEAKGGDEA
ncbi:MAG: ABC transporter permease, partial [Oscillospiraceae bacterium]|nr:ABC transporter permease [Oscillospiraceae bacterium]